MTNEKRNVYAPPMSNVEIDTRYNPAQTGLLLGMIYMAPAILFPFVGAVIMWFNDVADRIPYLVFLYLPAVEGAYFGWWCGRSFSNYSYTRLFLISIVQGASMMIVFIASVMLVMRLGHGDRIKFLREDIDSTLIGWIICAIWSFLMAATIRWKVLHLRKMQVNDGEFTQIKITDNL
jgi:hypothetical protein